VPDTRSRILTSILASPRPVTVEEIHEATGLHANTVRTHIAVLLAAGSISREPAGASGRGRPRWLYRSARRVGSPFQFLAEALTSQLANTADPALAESAADRWASAIPALPIAGSPDEAVDEAVGALNRLGFHAVASPVGDAIAVTACPYAALVDDNPLI
jgi:predicted ArsR family transcriptional regulator